MFNKVLIIGLGLIGGSFALALRKNNLAREIFAINRSQNSLKFALENKIIDGFVDLKDDLSSFDLIVLATPLSAYKEIIPQIISKINQDTILTDLGSLKNFIFALTNYKNFIATHPIAGLEKTGVENAKADLFLGKNLIICKNQNTNSQAVKKIENLWQKIGSKVKYLDAAKHDEIYALVSHLPQFLSFIFKEIIPIQSENKILKKAVRLDDSSSEMWKDIFELNKNNLDKFLKELLKNLQDFNLSSFISTKIKESEEIIFSEITPIFPEFFTRSLVILAFLKIKKIEEYQQFSGSGFKDFILSAQILQNFDEKKLTEKYLENKDQIVENIKKIKAEINSHVS